MSKRQDSPNHEPPGSAARDDPSGERQPLDRVKAPRQWRTSRVSGSEEPGVAAGEAADRPDLPEPPRAGDNPALAGSSENLLRGPGSAGGTLPSEPVPDLPDHYGEDRLVLLVRDPWWAYAWWEITETTFSTTHDTAGPGARFVLRVYNVSGMDVDGPDHNSFFDVDVRDMAGNWFLELARPGDSFRAELGLLDDAGRFHCMVRSNAITLPPDQVSSVVDEEWMVPDEEWQRLFEAAGGGVTMGVGSGEVLRMMEGRLRLDLSSGGLAHPPDSGSDTDR